MPTARFGFPKGAQRRLRRVALPVLVLGAATLLFSCQSDPPAAPDAPPTEVRLFQAPQDDINSLTYNPSFEPDFNNLTPQPWVEPATQAQTDDVSVFPDRIEFPLSHTEVLDWEPGRIVVAPPGKGAGKNGLGFARKVSSVASSGDKIVVMTVAPAIEEILQGDFRMMFDPDKAQVVDLSKVDAQWAADNLYFQTPDVEHMPGELLTDNYPPDIAPMGFFSKITKTVTKAVTSVAKAVATATKDVYEAVTPKQLTVSGGIKPEIKFGSKLKLPILKEFKKSFKTSGGYETELTMNADFSYDINVTLNSGVQMSGKIGVPGRGASSQMSLSFDSLAKWQMKTDVNLEAAISSVDGNVGDDLVDFLNKKLKNQELLYADVREKQMGDPDLKPSASWKKTLWSSAPMTQTLLAGGVVPVVFTETLQVDLECGFEAKASLTAHAELAQAASIKFKVDYDTGTNKATLTGPTLQNKFTTEVNVLGQGSVMATCGLVPRVNAFLYDMVGVFAGVRGSIVAKGEYTSECTGASNWPKGKVGFNLSADLGVQVGGRLQAPGASFFGITGQVAGLNVGPLEPFKVNIPLYKGEWEFKRGLGYCSTYCGDMVFNGNETDLDCGGGCDPCTMGKRCAENTDCKGSFCNDDVCGPDTCKDKVQDGEETDIDCGGKCSPCKVGKSCEKSEDCDSGACGGKTSAKPGVCVADHCTDAVKNKDEDGVDCGSKDCAKCADGTVVTRADSCLSGVWNGRTCVTSSCTDNIKGGDESDRDCGGTCSARCGFKQGCSSAADCAKTAPSCETTSKVCLRAAGMACTAPTDCAYGMCVNGLCAGTPGAYMRDLWVSPGTDVWAVGESATISRLSGGLWSSQVSGTTSHLFGVWGTALNDVWATGDSGTILHWDGAAWKPRKSDFNGTVWSPWGTSANSVWVAGDSGVIRYWNGTSWTAQTTGVTVQLRKLWGLNNSNIWAVGGFGTILKWNGTAWTPQMSKTTQHLQGVWGLDANNVWVVGEGGTILKWNGTDWSTQMSGTGQILRGVWGTSTNNVWVVGDGGTILKWDGSAWSPQTSGTTQPLDDVEGRSTNNIWAAGNGGTILQYNGTAWSKVQ